MLQLFKELKTTIKLSVTLVKLVGRSFISDLKELTVRANQRKQLIVHYISTMLP